MKHFSGFPTWHRFSLVMSLRGSELTTATIRSMSNLIAHTSCTLRSLDLGIWMNNSHRTLGCNHRRFIVWCLLPSRVLFDLSQFLRPRRTETGVFNHAGNFGQSSPGWQSHYGTNPKTFNFRKMLSGIDCKEFTHDGVSYHSSRAI